jgi:hypothetical protein
MRIHHLNCGSLRKIDSGGYDGMSSLIAAEVIRPGARVTATRPSYANALKDRDQLRCVAPLPWRDQHRQGQQPPSAAR